MSRAARCLGSSLRSLSGSHSGSSLQAARVLIPGTRTYGQAAVQRQQDSPPFLNNTKPRRTRQSGISDTIEERASESRPVVDADAVETSPERREESSADTRRAESKVPAHFTEYMNRLFSPLQFPPELAQRVLTHASHHLARRGHNAGFSFIGRRVLNAYFLMFLHSSNRLTPKDDIEQIASNALHTNLLGEHVAHAWGVGQVLVWAPSAPSEMLARNQTNLSVLRGAGLYKVQGEAVQAMMGAIYQQYGGTVAHRVFHTRILPLLRIKGGLPEAFYPEAQSICDKMGGEQGPLLPSDSSLSKVKA